MFLRAILVVIAIMVIAWMVGKVLRDRTGR